MSQKWMFGLCAALALVLVGTVAAHPTTVNSASPITVVWASRASMKTERLGLAVAAGANGRIYAIGGAGYGGLLATVEEYDPSSNTWTDRASLSSARYELRAAAAPNGRIYAIGGQDDSGVLGIVEEYDPATDTWRARASMPSPRAKHAVVTANNGRIYAIGGFRPLGGEDPLGTVEEYDPATDTWRARASMPTPRLLLGAAVPANGKIYAVGGHRGRFGGGIATVEEYDPTLDTWRTVGSLPMARHELGAAAVGDRVYAVGGFNCGGLANVDEYDPVGNTWIAQTPMPTARTELGIVTATSGKLYAIGGNTSTCNQFGQILGAVEEASISPSDVPTATLTPTATPTPTNSPAPPTVTPVVTSTPSPTATPLPASSLQALADTYVRSGAPNTSEGASTFIRLQASGDNRGLVRFDQAAIDSVIGSGTVVSAKLRLTITDINNNWGANGRTVGVHRLTVNWTEGNGFNVGGSPSTNGTGSGATWNCAIDSNISNQQPNCSDATAWEMGMPNNPSIHPWVQTATDSETITNGQSGVVEWDVTADVAAFRSGSASNYGWLIKKASEGQPGQVEFASRENGNSASRPVLIIAQGP